MDIERRCCGLRHLPEEIIEEIASRLPVESLLRFRCVSRSWCRLIDSERFIGIHLKVSRKNPSSEVAIVFGDYIDSPIFLELFGEMSGKLLIVGCCNGLVCLSSTSRNQLYLWNPFTRITKAIPSMDNIRIKKPMWFGWDESSGAYKVCAFTAWTGSAPAPSEYHKQKLMVYTSTTNSWKTVAARVRDSKCMHSNGVLLRGKVHWYRANRRENRRDIVSFDLKSEAFGVVELHSHVNNNNPLPPWQRIYISVGVVGECLCIVCTTVGDEIETLVWVMKEYGVKESWFKFMDHCPDLRFTTTWYTSSVWQAQVPDGEIVLTHATGFYVRDPLNRIHHFSRRRLCVQSLVSPSSV